MTERIQEGDVISFPEPLYFRSKTKKRQIVIDQLAEDKEHIWHGDQKRTIDGLFVV